MAVSVSFEKALRDRSRPEVAERLGVAAVIVMAIALRFSQLGHRSLWDDEAWTFFISSQGASHLLASLPRDAHPPLFYLIEAASVRLFGAHEWALRFPSAVSGVLLVALGMGIARHLMGIRGSILAGLLLACSPLLVYHSQEARSYSLLALLMLTAAWSWWKFVYASSKEAGIVAVCLTAAAGWTHYFGLLLLPYAICVFLLQGRWQRPQWWLAWMTAVLSVLPLAALLVQQRANNHHSYPHTDLPLASALLRSVLVLGAGPYSDGWPKHIAYGLIGAAIVAAVCVLALRRTGWAKLRFPALVLALSISALWLGAGLQLLPLRDSYLCMAVPGFCLLMAAVMAETPARWARDVMLGAVAMPALIGTYLLTIGDTRPNADFRVATRMIAALPAEGVLIARPWGDLLCYSFYQSDSAPIAVYRRDTASGVYAEARITRRPLTSTDALIQQKQSLWLVGKASKSSEAGIIALTKQLQQHGFSSTADKTVRGVLISRWQRTEIARLPQSRCKAAALAAHPLRQP